MAPAAWYSPRPQGKDFSQEKQIGTFKKVEGQNTASTGRGVNPNDTFGPQRIPARCDINAVLW